MNLSITLICAADKPKTLEFHDQLRLSYFRPHVPPFFKNEEWNLYDDYHNDPIFPGVDILGWFQIINHSGNSLKLGSVGDSFPNYLHLEYSYPDAAEDFKPLKFTSRLRDVDSLRFDGGNDAGQSNSLAPFDTLIIDITCSWQELSELKVGQIYLRWIFDNEEAAAQDSFITPAKYERRFASFRIFSLDSRLDSIYYMDMLSSNMNARGQYQEALDLCNQMILIDSTLINPYCTAADVLWKMGRFEEGIAYAEKGIETVIWQRDHGHYDISDVHRGDWEIANLKFFIEQCQKKEKWDWRKAYKRSPGFPGF